MRRVLLAVYLCLLPLLSFANQTHFLDADQAFQFNASLQPGEPILLTRFAIAPGYHLYQNQLAFVPTQAEQVKLGPIDFPQWTRFQDNGEDYPVYQKAVIIPIVFKQHPNAPFDLLVTYQGCADSGLCYPPITKKVSINLTTQQIVITDPSSATANDDAAPTAFKATQTQLQDLLLSKHYAAILLTFLALGLLLTFTPCVFPMIPILSGLIIGQKDTLTTWKAFSISLAYVLGMSLTYTLLGIIVGLAGGHLQAALQSAWVLSATAIVFVALALSLFGLYDIRLPSALETRLSHLSNRQASGTYIGALLMGILSSLIVSPCVSAPLVGALGYIGQTGDAVLGGLALFCLSLGMGLPLLLIGTTGGGLLPKSGAWMNQVKYGFGIIMLGMAIWLLARILPGSLTLALWAILAIGIAIFLGATDAAPAGPARFSKAIGTVLLIYGSIMLLGAATGNTTPWLPLKNTLSGQVSIKPAQLAFTRIASVQDLQQQLKQSILKRQPIMLDFYADWCVACKEMEANVFSDPEVQQALADIHLLKADVTDNNANDRDLQNHLKVIAPPTIIFFTPDGQEAETVRIVGEMDKAAFLKRLQVFKQQLKARQQRASTPQVS